MGGLVTDGLKFSIKREFRGEQRLVEEVNAFKQAFNEGYVDSDDFNDFLTRFGQFLEIEKPSFGQNISFMFQHQFQV